MDIPAPETRPTLWRTLLPLLGGPLLTVLLLQVAPPSGMGGEAWALVALAAWMVLWWLSSVVPVAATALIPIPFMPLLGIGSMKDVAANYANPLIYLFLGGFLIAAAMQAHGLHRRIALKIVSVVGVSPAGIVAGFMLATAFLSMWISNTATTVMMFAVGLSVIDFVAGHSDDKRRVRNFGVALMLGIAYAASIGGVGTLIGTPPNVFMAGFLQSSYGIELSFARWMLLGVPVLLVLLPAAWLLLTRFVFPVRGLDLGQAGGMIKSELSALGPMSYAEKVVAFVFSLAALGWIFRRLIVDTTGLAITDTTIALVAALLLFAWPQKRGANEEEGRFVLTWEATRTVPWGVLILFGGGLALAGGFKSTGLAEWIGGQAGLFGTSPAILVLVALVAIVFLTELTSNIASTATFLPIVAAIAVGLGEGPMLLVLPVALGASMAFMMPVATPPNAIVFSYEDMKLPDMVRAGLWLNIIAIAVIYGAVWLLAPLVFG